MSPTKVGGAGGVIVHNIRRHTLLHSGNGFLGGCFTSVSTPPPEGMGEKAKQTIDKVMGAAKEISQKLKGQAVGKEPTSDSSKVNHGVQNTDSSCEDVRDRPGGYS